MTHPIPTTAYPLAAHWPIQLEYWHWGYGVAFLVAALIVVALGMRSLTGLGPARKWVSIAARVGVLGVLFLIVCGVRWTRMHKDLELLVVRDVSGSTKQFTDFAGPSLDDAFRRYLAEATRRGRKRPEDRVGQIIFDQSATIEAPLNTELVTGSAPIHDAARESQTDAASALELALATFRPDAMHRLLLVWDGNQTVGNIDPVVQRAKSMNIPIDVMPLKYAVKNEVLMERFVGPTWKRENERFTIEVFARSTNITDVTGRLEVAIENSKGRTLLPLTPDGATSRIVTLKPGLNRFPVPVAGQTTGVLRFRATIDGHDIKGGVIGPGGTTTQVAGDTLLGNNTSEGFTVIQGKGKVLYIDNALDDAGQLGPGKLLADALEAEGITLETKTFKGFPKNLIDLQSYDAVILQNVRHGDGGLDNDQERNLAQYVHDMGGGLVMIGGKDAFGAGGWQQTKTEEILPVNMEIPATRMVPKGALVLVMHSCEMPEGNYWGEQCALQAIKALGDRDEIGVISYGWGGRGGGGGVGGAQWDFALDEKRDGTKVMQAIKAMQLGDMPSFDDALTLALKGDGPQKPCLLNSKARQKHIIIISDGDPQGPNAQLYNDLIAAQVSVSTITVYPHNVDPQSKVAPVMREMAERTKGRYYGPIEKNPAQLPQIFIKEATVVRRSLIFEQDPIPVKIPPQLSSAGADLIKGMPGIPKIRGMVLTSRKDNPQIEVPLVAGEKNDPVLAHWQAGLGRSVAFMSDATDRWANYWVASGSYGKFWAQVVRSVARPPMSTDFDVRVTQDGNVGRIVVEAANKETGAMNFVNLSGIRIGPDGKPVPVRLTQVGPGLYQAEFPIGDPGSYIAMLNYSGAGNVGGQLMGGLASTSSPETRELQSNDTLLERIADVTGGRVIGAFDAGQDLFSRAGMPPASSPLPVWDVLLPFLLALIIIDVAVRRIAWDWLSTKRAMAGAADWVRSYTTVRKVENAEQTIGALKQVRGAVAEQRFKPSGDAGVPPPLPTSSAGARPDPKAKFEAKEGVSGDITQVVGGASNKPVPPPPKKIQPKGQQPEPGNTMGGLLAAKRRAQDKIKDKEQEQ